MMTPRTARMLTRYNQWANKTVFDAVAALPEGEATRPRVSLFKNMVHMLNHNYVIDRIFQAHLEDRKSTRLNSSHIQKSRMPSSA